jgi:hypothetical protein
LHNISDYVVCLLLLQHYTLLFNFCKLCLSYSAQQPRFCTGTNRQYVQVNDLTAPSQGYLPYFIRCVLSVLKSFSMDVRPLFH